VRKQVKQIEDWLTKVRATLVATAKTTGKKSNARTKRITLTGKDLPHRRVKLYVDFVITFDDEAAEGSIVYGALRKPRYPHSIGPNKRKTREEKPLASLSVSDQGKVCIKGKLHDEWWLTGNKRDVKAAVQEMHYRVLNHISSDALNWVNEPLLP